MMKCKGQYWTGVEGWKHFDSGDFHCFGSNYEEFESGSGNYSVVIVELPDGRIVMPPPDKIQFIDKEDT